MQYAFCVMVSGGQLSDTRADELMRAGPKIGIIELSCSTLTALVSHLACFETLVQMVFCVMVSGGRLSDTGAVRLLR